jgi:hypothetical protein
LKLHASGRHGGAKLVLAVVGISVLLGACSDMGAARPVMVANRTDQTLELTYEVTVAGVDYVLSRKTLEPAVALKFDFPFYGERCGHGRIVAASAGAIVATLDEPCQGDRWEVGAPDPSPS